IGQARSEPGEDVMEQPQMARLDAMNKQVRKLAQDLEASGRVDDASAVYWGLADFPSLTSITLPNGQTRFVGYVDSMTDPTAEAYRRHAILLNTKAPKLLIDKTRVSNGWPRTGISNAKEGQAYLKAFEELATGPLKEGVIPRDYMVAIYQALRWGTPEQACDLIQRAYLFEPFVMTLKEFVWFSESLADQRKKLNLPPQPCVVAGLTAP
ncbi:MAG: hypothetical protein V4532_13280, partial [Pseudomonadota bacterium]